MPCRYTHTEKWDKPWFMRLSPYAKVLFEYLRDKCDVAGIYETNVHLASSQTGLSPRQIDRAIAELAAPFEDGEKRVIVCATHLWLVKFCKHQKNLPLNPENNAHKAIIRSLEAHSGVFGADLRKALENQDLIRGYGGAREPLPRGLCNGNGKGNGSSLQEEEGLGEETKVRFLEFVLLTQGEYDKLCAKFGKAGTDERIERLNHGIGSKGYKYKSHYHTILSWEQHQKDRSTAGQPVEETPEQISARLHAKGLLYDRE